MNSRKRWYIRDRINGQVQQLWLFDFDSQTATRTDVTNPESGAGTFFRAEPGESIWDSIRRHTPWLDPDMAEGQFHCRTLAPGEFYPRVARPLALARQNRLCSPSVLLDRSFVANA